MIQQTTILGFNALGYESPELDLTKPQNIGIMFMGEGENGNNIQLLYKYGPFQSLKDGTKVGMILWALQAPVSYGFSIDQVGKIVAFFKSKYKINALMTMGYSNGAQRWADYLESSESLFQTAQGHYWASAQTEDQAPYGPAVFTPSLYAKYKVRDVRACGALDGGFYGTQTLETTKIAAGNPLIPNVFIVYPKAGHDGGVWLPFFQVGGQLPALGNTDIFVDFNTVFPASAVVVTPPPPPPPPPIIQTAATVILTTATAAQLATLSPANPSVYVNPTTKVITGIWSGTAWI